MENGKQLTPEEWKNLKDEKQLRILKGQSLNIASEFLSSSRKNESKINLNDFAKVLEETAQVIYNHLKEKRWHQTL